MAIVTRLPHAAAQIALLTVATSLVLTACSGSSDGTLTEVAASSAAPVKAAPTPTASPSPSPSPSSSRKGTAKPAPETTKAGPKLVSSDVSQLKRLGITLGDSVLIDVADDGLDRYLEIGENGVDFTGTSKKDTTMMALNPAKVAQRTEGTKNQVVIAPPFWNEDLGAGSCVVDQAKGRLDLATCTAGAADQTWTVVPAGDSGQFELHGAHTDIRVEKGRITTDGEGYVGLQTIDFA